MQLQETNIVAMTNQKGGCGKTTTTVSLAAALADLGLNVAVTDTDPQCNATDTFNIDREQLAADGGYTLADAYIAKRPARELQFDFADRFSGRLTVIPGHKGIGTVAHQLEAQLQASIANGEFSDLDADDVKNEHRHRLKSSLDSLRGEKDIVLIDTPPDLGFLMTTALIAADWFIIPVFLSGYDLKGLETLLRNVQKVRERYNPELRLLGVLLGNTEGSPSNRTEAIDRLFQAGTTMNLQELTPLVEQLNRIESVLNQLVVQKTEKDWYTVAELSAILGKAEFTVREWCRLGRIHAKKRDCGRGLSLEWIVSHDELKRFQNEGLLPLAPAPSLRRGN